MAITINEARTLANIATRAKSITEDYRLFWDRYEKGWFVCHKTDASRRYRVTGSGCQCPSTTHYGCCKHFLGIEELIEVERKRYILLGMRESWEKIEAFAEEVFQAEYGVVFAKYEALNEMDVIHRM